MIERITSIPIEEASQVHFIKYWDRLKDIGMGYDEIEALLPQQWVYWIDMVEREPAIERGELPVMDMCRNKMLEFFTKWVSIRR